MSKTRDIKRLCETNWKTKNIRFNPVFEIEGIVIFLFINLKCKKIYFYKPITEYSQKFPKLDFCFHFHKNIL